MLDVVERSSAPEPWEEGDNIPWHEPGFSARMLREHLSEEHDAASRRPSKLDRHVDWIHRDVLLEAPTRVLDLGCGPGLYTSRLAALGHSCTGVDYSPAAVDFARRSADRLRLDCRYVEGDLRHAAYGSGYGLVMVLYGELNVFAPADARLILAKASAATDDGGLLLLEPHTPEAVAGMGARPRTWYSSASGLFGETPHLCLSEHHWDEARRAATTRHFVIDAASGAVTRHAQTMQAYTDDDYVALLADAGYGEVAFHASLTGDGGPVEPGLVAITARKRQRT